MTPRQVRESRIRGGQPPARTARPDIRAPEAVADLVRRLERAGYETWTVGGAVRDALRGRPGAPEDWDLATRATPRRVRRLFRRTVPVGIEHGTVGVFGHDGVLYEVTTFRHDVITYGRKAVVAFAETLEEDLARRDFTVNAIAWHPLRLELRDPHGGLRDLMSGTLRTVGDPAERFREDYLRVLRGLRFAGSIRLEVVQGTWDAMVAAAPGLAGLSRERVREELLKVLAGPKPSRTLELYEASGARASILPALSHGLDRRALDTLDAVRGRRRAELRMAVLLLFGLGRHLRLAAEASGEAHPLGEEDAFAGEALAEVDPLLAGLRFSNAERQRITAVVAGAGSMAPARSLADDAAARRRWLARLGRQGARDVLRTWFAALRADPAPDGAVRRRRQVGRVLQGIRGDLRAGMPLAVRDLALSGRDLIELGWSPGPGMGRLLRRLLEAVWEDPTRNGRAALTELAYLYEAEARPAAEAQGESDARAGGPSPQADRRSSTRR